VRGIRTRTFYFNPNSIHHPLLASLRLCVFALTLLLFGCDLRFGAPPTATPLPPTSTQVPPPALTVVWVENGNLRAWREDDSTLRTLATGAVIQPYLPPNGQHVAFTRGAQGDSGALWVVGIDGAGETELVASGDLRSLRDGHPQIGQVAWLDNRVLYFNTLQMYDWGSVMDDDLYRVELDGSPQLILPPGAGGQVALSPDGQQIAVVRSGEYDMQPGHVSLLDPLGARVRDKLTFTAVSAPSEPPFYPSLAWSADSTFLRVPIPNRDNDRVALWRVPVEAEARIFGYITAARDALPVWGGADERMLYGRPTPDPQVIELVSADADGRNPQLVDTGAISNPRWLLAGDSFAYDKDGATWIARRGSALLKLVDAVGVRFAGADRYVYNARGELRAAHLDGTGAAVIASSAQAFDAVLSP
jgi:hypothetical protein